MDPNPLSGHNQNGPGAVQKFLEGRANHPISRIPSSNDQGGALPLDFSSRRAEVGISRPIRRTMTWFHTPTLNRKRISIAFAIAMIADTIPLLLCPLGWSFLDEILDGIAMLLLSGLIGFHPLLLPTFILECLPVADMLPTWTGCVALIVSLRQNQPAPEAKASSTEERTDYIDV